MASFVLGGVFFLFVKEARAAGCCQILKSSGSTCQDMDIIDYCACDKLGSDCQGVEYTPTASCNKTKNVCETPKGSSGSSSGGSAGSSKSGGSWSASNPAASTPASGAATPKPAVFGAPTNLGDPNGTPGKSVFIPKCADTEGNPGGGCRDVGAFLALFVNYANATFGIIGAVAFLFFIYGGVMLLISGGEAERVKKGRDAIMGAIIGLLIVFGAQLLVRFVIQGLVPAANQNPAKPLEVKLPDTTEKK